MIYDPTQVPVDEYGLPIMRQFGPPAGPVATLPPPSAPEMAPGGPMQAPAPMAPDMVMPPPPGYLGRFGAALRMAPAFQGRPGMSGGQGFAGGLMAGLSGGLQANAAEGQKQAEMKAQAINTKNKTIADFNNAVLMDSIKGRIANDYKVQADERGKFPMTAQMLTDIGVDPKSPGAVGRLVDPIDFAQKKAAFQNIEPQSTITDPKVARVLGQPVGAKVKASEYRQAFDTAYPKPTGGGLTGSNEPMTDSAISFVGDYLIRTGTLLPFGMGNAANRGKVFDYVSHNSTASTVAGNKAGLASDAASLKTMQTGLDQVTAYKNTATANAKVLDAAMAGIPDAGNKPLNWLMRTAADKFGSTGTSGFNTALETVRPEFQRILQSGGQLSSGAVLTVEGRKDMKATLDGNATVGQIRRSLAVLETDAENRRKSYQDQIGVIQKRIGGGMSMGGGDRVRIVRNGVPGTILRTDVLPTDTVVQ